MWSNIVIVMLIVFVIFFVIMDELFVFLVKVKFFIYGLNIIFFGL